MICTPITGCPGKWVHITMVEDFLVLYAHFLYLTRFAIAFLYGKLHKKTIVNL